MYKKIIFISILAFYFFSCSKENPKINSKAEIENAEKFVKVFCQYEEQKDYIKSYAMLSKNGKKNYKEKYFTDYLVSHDSESAKIEVTIMNSEIIEKYFKENIFYFKIKYILNSHLSAYEYSDQYKIIKVIKENNEFKIEDIEYIYRK